MTSCSCIVQEGQINSDIKRCLTNRLEDFAQQSFQSGLDISWTVIPQGRGFTAGKPSTASVVALTAPEPLDQDTRTSLLKELCDLWISEAKCSVDEVVGVIADPRA